MLGDNDQSQQDEAVIRQFVKTEGVTAAVEKDWGAENVVAAVLGLSRMPDP